MYPKGAERKDMAKINHTASVQKSSPVSGDVNDSQNSDVKIVMAPKNEVQEIKSDKPNQEVVEVKSEKPNQELKDPKPEKASDSAYETAAQSEKAAGKSAPNGIKSFSGKSIDEVVDDSDEDADKVAQKQAT